MDRPREPLPTRVDDTPDLPPAYGDALDAGLAAARRWPLTPARARGDRRPRPAAARLDDAPST